MLGHSSWEMTGRYLHIRPGERKTWTNWTREVRLGKDGSLLAALPDGNGNVDV